ncbi:hypothetical protein RvY_11749 [Ramazzottius varieornatus]|uniref:C2H2-type domain-containing protein n=1 Tax=Ramazzottius varieornatus TaxID=947166 RepID=A0A1D1VH77_RAMVA|nr:hypothetical protein RvY_11749 [Ramazzottius varieornatus]
MDQRHHFRCEVEGCDEKYYTVDLPKKHVSRVHPGVDYEDTVTGSLGLLKSAEQEELEIERRKFKAATVLHCSSAASCEITCSDQLLLEAHQSTAHRLHFEKDAVKTMCTSIAPAQKFMVSASPQAVPSSKLAPEDSTMCTPEPVPTIEKLENLLALRTVVAGSVVGVLALKTTSPTSTEVKELVADFLGGCITQHRKYYPADHKTLSSIPFETYLTDGEWDMEADETPEFDTVSEELDNLWRWC